MFFRKSRKFGWFADRGQKDTASETPQTAHRCQPSIQSLREKGVEVLTRNGADTVTLPRNTVIEAPAGLKWTQYLHSLRLGAFSYQVSGYCFAARIGRYCSIGENVQIGRQNHPMDWLSTSPAFYMHDKMINLDGGFAGAEDYHSYRFTASRRATKPRMTTIGHDVWIGHDAYIAAGVTIGNGAIVAARAVVTKDVPPMAMVAGNPAEVKKFRFPPDLIDAVLRSQWWRFAPWQLQNFDPSDPETFTATFSRQSEKPQPFKPDLIDLRTCS